jgi:DNA-nicking Smr family endonuclease
MSKNKKGRGLSGEDISLWEKVARTILAYPGKKVEAAEVEAEKPIKKSKKISAARAVHHAPPKPKARAVPPTDISVNDTTALDGSTAEKFRKGKMKISATLDLHGMRQAEAHAALNDFIQLCYVSQKRCVRVITGKGQRSGGGQRTGTGVLQQQVPHWLNQPVLRECVLSVVHAPAKDGGTGALYVLIKRQR